MSTPPSLYLEHAEDVLTQWLSWRQTGPVALVMITGTVGGAVRDVGALMVVRESGEAAGYISGGCIDADVALQAVSALKTGNRMKLRYGADSPFTDLPLPCGGAIDLLIETNADETALRTCRDRLRTRKPARLKLGGDTEATYYPKLRLRIAGRGADCLALARLAHASGIETILQLRDGDDVHAAQAQGFSTVTALETPSCLPAFNDDPWTAFVLMFHDTDWEVPLLKQVLGGPAFYVGAVGSQKTHVRRYDALVQAGLSSVQADRVRGPIGLIKSMRDASMLAISTLAEVVEVFHKQRTRPLASTALVLLAAGQSSRFEDGDKLLAQVGDRPLLAHAASRFYFTPVGARIAVIGPDQTDREAELRKWNWTITVNDDAASGQASSLRAGVNAARSIAGIDRVMILLADMPDVTEVHLRGLAATFDAGEDAVMSEADGVLTPPAMFADHTFDALCAIEGDKGARSVFAELEKTATQPMRALQARDIDRLADIIDRLHTQHG